MIKWTFEVAIYNNLKIKIIRHRVIGDGCICEGISHEYLQSQSVSILSSFKYRSVMVVFKKTWRSNISFKKETEKIVLLQMKGLIQIIAKFRTVKYLCMFLSSNTNILLRGPLNIVHQILCSSTYSKKEQIESLYFPEGK